MAQVKTLPNTREVARRRKALHTAITKIEGLQKKAARISSDHAVTIVRRIRGHKD